MSTLHHITNDMSQKQDNCNVCRCGEKAIRDGLCIDCVAIANKYPKTAVVRSSPLSKFRQVPERKLKGFKNPDYVRACLTAIEAGAELSASTISRLRSGGYVKIHPVLTNKAKKLIETA